MRLSPSDTMPLSLLPLLVAARRETTFREAGARHNLFMGSQFQLHLLSDPSYRALHSAQYGLSTAGNVCKWSATEREEGRVDVGECTTAFAYARSANQSFRGHNLCWGNNNPKWLRQMAASGNGSAAALEHALVSHVTRVMGDVKKAAGGASPLAWDVVNEAVNDTAFFKPTTWCVRHISTPCFLTSD